MIKRVFMTFLIILFMVSGAYAADNLKSAFSEGKFQGQLRVFQFTRDFDESETRKDIAAGGMLYYRTDPLYGINGGLGFYTGQEMGLNDDHKDVYGLLAKDENGDHESFSVLGEAFIQGEFSGIGIKVGRQEMETPFVNTDDNRLTPQSTEAYSLSYNGISNLEIVTSYVSKIRGKAETKFVSMTEYAEVGEEEEPVFLGGLAFDAMERMKLQVWDFYAKEFFNEIYLRGDFSQDINDVWIWSGSAQYLSQKDVGDGVGGSLDSYFYAVEAGIEAYGCGVSGAFAQVGDDEILIPWGHDLICSLMVNDAVRAEEQAILGVFKYDFGNMGIDGLVVKIKYMDLNTPDSGINASPDFTETDFDATYKFKGYFENMSLRLRHAIVNKDEDLGGQDYNDSRLMLKYDFGI